MTAQLSRERLEEIALEVGDAPQFIETIEMARMLLAGMSAKSRKLFTCTGCGAEGLDEPLESICHCNEDGAHWAESVVFTAPPAPVAVPDALEQFALFMAEEAIKSGEDQSGWRGKASNAAHEYALACRAAMQAEPVTGDFRENAETSTNELKPVPEGWKLVPVEPTEAMMLHKSGCKHHAWDDADCAMRQTRRLVWAHMLAAAPAAPEQEV